MLNLNMKCSDTKCCESEAIIFYFFKCVIDFDC